jgi:hypothetical protein
MACFRWSDPADDTLSIAMALRNQNLLSAWTSMPSIVPSVLCSQVSSTTSESERGAGKTEGNGKPAQSTAGNRRHV